MNTIFIKLFFSLICIFIFLYMFSFSLFEIKKHKNIFGGISTILFTIRKYCV